MELISQGSLKCYDLYLIQLGHQRPQTRSVAPFRSFCFWSLNSCPLYPRLGKEFLESERVAGNKTTIKNRRIIGCHFLPINRIKSWTSLFFLGTKNIDRAVSLGGIAGAHRGGAEKNAKGISLGPVRQLTNRHFFAGIGCLRQLQRNIEIDLIAPHVGVAFKGQNVQNPPGGFRFIQLGLDGNVACGNRYLFHCHHISSVSRLIDRDL